MNERACPYCDEECDGATVQDGQQVCCGFGCEHCCEVDRSNEDSDDYACFIQEGGNPAEFREGSQ